MVSKLSILLILLLCSFNAFSQSTLENSTIAIQDQLDTNAPFSFNPKFRYDTTANILYVWQDGVWAQLGGVSDGYAQGANYDSLGMQLNVDMADPATDFSIDLSALANHQKLTYDTNTGLLTITGGSEVNLVYPYYQSDADAATAGVPIGAVYKVGFGNKYGMSWGSLRVRVN